jgi:hypothetical protein
MVAVIGLAASPGQLGIAAAAGMGNAHGAEDQGT